MNPRDKIPTELNNALYQTLLRRIPPGELSNHLEDVTNLLLDALFKGETKINLNNNSIPKNLKATGWPKAHLDAIRESGWLEGDSSPIVLKGNFLSWRKWNDDIELVIDELLDRSNYHIKNMLEKEINLAKGTNKNLNHEQEIAVKSIEKNGIILLSGGPGTGKTTTLIKIIERYIYLNPSSRIGLAAPTGKATRRLKETLQKNIDEIGNELKDQILKIPCFTLHTWLNARGEGFGRNRKNPLELDLLVIDEMSMIDLSLMKTLLEAIPYETKLVLVGDPDQLPPVGIGCIWHELHEKTVLEKFKDGSIYLEKIYRNRGYIASSSNILKKEGIEVFWKKLTKLPKSSNIKLHLENSNEIPKNIINRLKSHQKQLKILSKNIPRGIQIGTQEELQKNNQINDLLIYIENITTLCPLRNGPWGVNRIHKAIIGDNFKKDISNWPEGTPVMCSENQTELGIANGDIGVAIGEKENLRFIFKTFSREKTFRMQSLHPARIKKVEPAFAMTIHKSQGSESEEVILLWPYSFKNNQTEVTYSNYEKNYEERLLYTAITRAKENLEIYIKT